MANEGGNLVFSVEKTKTVNLKILYCLYILLLHSWRRGEKQQQQQ
jgi:hypothetical protein